MTNDGTTQLGRSGSAAAAGWSALHTTLELGVSVRAFAAEGTASNRVSEILGKGLERLAAGNV